jgi:hypothetical protein
MPIDEKEDPVNPKEVKGINTAGNFDKIELPEYTPEVKYKQPKTAKESFLSQLGESAFENPSTVSIKGTNFLVSDKVSDLYTPVNLAKGIPDKHERQKFINEHGSKMVKLLDPDKFGVIFDDDIKAYQSYKAKNYNIQVKKFLDDLDENQGFLAEAGNTAAKLTGLVWNTAGIIPLTYGLGKALFTWDAQNIYNNGLFDFWETVDEGINTKFAVYGGSDYANKPDGTPKNFFARFVSHPMKSLNADIMPAVNFVGSAVATELLATAAAPFTGGASLLANTSRLLAQGTNAFAKSYKVLRGLDALSDFNNMRKIASLTQKYKAGLGTVSSMVRSAGYESSLIARDTYEQTLQQSKLNYLENKGLSGAELIAALDDPNSISQSELALMKTKAENSSELAWFANVPLVGFSNMIQFSKAFSSGYKINQALSRLNPLKLTGTTIGKDGLHIARAEAMGTARRVAGYAATGLKSGVTEAFEEYAQGVMQQGFSDYFSAEFTNDSVKSSMGFLDTMSKAARQYANSVEGQDSMAIGALMGMLGLRLPVRINPQTGKLERGWESYGGLRQEIKETKKAVEESKEAAKRANANPTNQVLKNNFQNMAKNITIQAEMDKALKKGDIFNFKNKEYESWHSHVTTRIKNNIVDTLYQDLDAAEKLPLEEFNKQYGVQGALEFTEESRKTAIEKARSTTREIVKANDEVNDLFNDTRLFVDFFNKNYKGLEDPAMLTEGLKDQMVFLHGATKNLQKREKELGDQVRDLSNGHVNSDAINQILAKITDVNKEGQAELITNAREAYKAELENWRSVDPTSYKLYEKQLTPLLKDLTLIKERKARLAEMYNVLFTNKGAKEYSDLYVDLLTNRAAKFKEDAEKKAKEDLSKAKSSNKAATAKADEKSVTGENKIFDAQVDAELAATEAALAAELAATNPESAENAQDFSSLIASVDAQTVIDNLQTAPALFHKILEILDERGTPALGITNIDQLYDADPQTLGNIAAVYAELVKERAENKGTPTVKLNYIDPTDSTQPSEPVEQSDDDIANSYINTTTLADEEDFKPMEKVTDSSIILVTHDKKIVNGQLVRDSKTGKWEVWSNQEGKTDQPIDTKIVNSPEFLPNKELKDDDNIKEAKFEIADNKYNNEKERAPQDIAIDVYHGDVFIGRLPAWKKGFPEHLLQLRKDIVAQEDLTAITKETTVSTDDKADIERRRQEELKQKNIDGYNLGTEGDEFSNIEKRIKNEEDNVKNASSEVYKEAAQKRLDSFKEIKSELEKINAKYDAALAALEQTTTPNNRLDLINKHFETIVEVLQNREC